jgi:D-arabinose 1-dehydrogenase-like Zn-dependent alcohol dehydrogenase
MRAAQLIDFKKPLLIGQVPDPIIGPKDVIVRVEACGVCRGDWLAWKGKMDWNGIIPEPPIILGHEFSGVIEEVGREVTNFRVGDRVISPYHAGCTHCENCMSGNSNRCDDLSILGFSYNGTFAEYVRIPNGDFNLIWLPDEVDSLTGAAISCRYMTGYHGVMRGNVQAGDWLVVHGVGGVGLSVIQVGNASGALVIAVDVDDAKLKKAKEEGAVVTINARKENVIEKVLEVTKGGAHVSFEAVGLQETILNSVHSLKKGGRHVQIGLTEKVGIDKFPINSISAKELQIIGVTGNPHAQYERLLTLISNGKLNPKSLVTKEISLNDVTTVLEDMNNYKTFGYNVITKF